MKRFFSILSKIRVIQSVLIFFVLLSGTINASDYVFTQYKIDVQVNENNTFFITEQVGAHFLVDKHGIIRTIPMKNNIIRLDGSTATNRAKISNINVVGDLFTTFNENGNKAIQIGNPDMTINGNKEYVISYLYDIGKDKSKDFDEFYFNLIGYEFDTSIEGIEFRITLPKAFDTSKLGFSSGRVGLTDNQNITYEVNGNVITGKYEGILNEGEALTVRLELPEGYFVSAEKYDIYLFLSILLPILFVLIVFGTWYKYGRDDVVIETVEFYPPEGFNSAEVGFMYKGVADTNDVVSLLIYLAEKGYIAISETEEKVLFFTNKSFKITKIKDYDGNNHNERLFLDGLFAKRQTTITSLSDVIDSFKSLNQKTETPKPEAQNSSSVEVFGDSLKLYFHTTVAAIVSNLNKKENKEVIFEKKSLNKGFIGILMIIATFALITVKPMLEYHEPPLLIFGLVFPLVGISVFFGMIFSGAGTSVSINGKEVQSIIAKIIFGALFGIPFSLVPFFFLVLPALLATPGYLTAYIIGIICVFLMFLINRYMLKRTPYGTEMLGKIKGFRNFLNTAEKSKLEEMVKQDPVYFYNILPFTYVLGVSDKWIKKFETIAMQPPNWYHGSSSFSAAAFGTFINSTMKTTSTAVSPSSSSSSGSSGGGSSGGGSGGGGGRSW